MSHTPKLFISYSWSTPTHEEWVLNLASELVESGIHVIFDKWDLKEGDESTAFMERMVTSPDVQRVLIISDAVYVQKANKRTGGVGLEAQIISKEIYENSEQSKFVVAVTEKDENGKHCLPTYYTSRMYIDFTDSSEYYNSFEKLVRWVYNKPLYKRPELGKTPEFLSENAISLGTTSLRKRVENAFRESKGFAYGALSEYLMLFSQNLERLRIKYENEQQYINDFDKSLKAFTPYREKFLKVCNTIFLYDLSDSTIKIFHSFFESLLPYMDKPKEMQSYRDLDFDNYKFIIYELFLHFIALLIKLEKFQYTDSILNLEFFVSSKHPSLNNLNTFTVFSQYNKSIHHIMKDKTVCPQGTLIKDRVKEHDTLKFIDIMQADFLLYVRAYIIYNPQDYSDLWLPETNAYTYYEYNGTYPIFSKCKSVKYFDEAKVCIGIKSKEDLASFIKKVENKEVEVPRWQHMSFSPKTLINLENICTTK